LLAAEAVLVRQHQWAVLVRTPYSQLSLQLVVVAVQRKNQMLTVALAVLVVEVQVLHWLHQKLVALEREIKVFLVEATLLVDIKSVLAVAERVHQR
jgi:hypothetical protein